MSRLQKIVGIFKEKKILETLRIFVNYMNAENFLVIRQKPKGEHHE